MDTSFDSSNPIVQAQDQIVDIEVEMGRIHQLLQKAYKPVGHLALSAVSVFATALLVGAVYLHLTGFTDSDWLYNREISSGLICTLCYLILLARRRWFNDLRALYHEKQVQRDELQRKLTAAKEEASAFLDDQMHQL